MPEKSLCVCVCVCVHCNCYSNLCHVPYLSDSGPFQGLIFPGDLSRSRPKSAEALVLQGEKPVMEPKMSKKSETKKMSYKASGKIGAVKAANKPKIRNYNQKDQ